MQTKKSHLNFYLALLVHCFLLTFSLFLAPRYWLKSTLEDEPKEHLQYGLCFLLPGITIMHGVINSSTTSFVRVAQICFGFLGSVLLFYMLAVTFGAPIIDLVHLTLLWCILMSTLVAIPSIFIFAWDTRRWVQAFAKVSIQTNHEAFVVFQAIGAILGAYLGALPIPLDWDRPWQKWPITLTYGAFAGSIIGCIFAIFYSHRAHTTIREKIG